MRSSRLPLVALTLLAVAGARAEKLFGITVTGTNLVSFDSAAPGTQTTIGALSGVVTGQTIRAIDFRPATGELYAISTAASSTTGVAQLYTVNLATGALTTVGSTFSLLTSSPRVSMDFNPVVDRIRVVEGNGQNLRLNPVTGAIAATDTSLAYAPGDARTGTPFLGDVAYTNNFAGATSTTLYGYDYLYDSLVTVGSVGGAPNSPNGGLLNTVGSAFSTPTTGSASIGFDISGATGVGYINLDNGTAAVDSLYTINLGTGSITSLGLLGQDFLDLSVAPVPEPAPLAAIGLGVVAMLRRRKKA